MTDAKQSRGRPKGSGIDDRIWLREMARLMRLDPTLRPTSAIKALGVTDPSTIRRLRDKFASIEDQPAMGEARQRSRVAAQAVAADPVRRQAPARPLDPKHSRAPDPAPANPAHDALAVLWGSSLQGHVLMAGLGLLTLQTLLRSPATNHLLLAQITLGDALASSLRLHAETLARSKR